MSTEFKIQTKQQYLFVKTKQDYSCPIDVEVLLEHHSSIQTKQKHKNQDLDLNSRDCTI